MKRVELAFGDISHYHIADDAFDSLFPKAEFSEADVESLKSIPEHVNQILKR